MASTTFTCEILTPEGEVFKDEVQMVSTRTTVGSIGILAHHQPLLGMLDPTELRLYRSDTDIVRLAQGEGYVQVTSDRVLILVEEALPPEELEVKIDVEPGLSVRGDPALVRQVMISLLTNACKYTPGGGAVTLRALAGSDDDAVIEVSDTGTGIPAEERDRIFERFYRGSDALQKEGFGLGLSIARRMVELMDGEIGVRSEVGEGSTFWVRLPVAQPTPTPVA